MNEKRLRLSRDLERQRLLLQSILESMSDGVVVADEKGNFLAFNPAAERILGIGAVEGPPSTWTQEYGVFDSETLRPVPERDLPLVRAIAGEEVNEVELFVRNSRIPDGTYVSINGRPLKDSAGRLTGGVVVFRDITERKALEAELRQSQKTEALGRLAGGVAHNFNNMMTPVLGFSEMLLAALKPDDPLLEYVREIKRSGEKAADVTRQILAFGRKQMLRPALVDLNQLVRELVGMLGPLVGETIVLRTDLDDNLALIRADRGQIDQMIVNLALNARDAMVQGGILSICTENVRMGPGERFGNERIEPGPYVSITVKDTGVGMTAETLSHLFEPFFTTKGLARGTGLGLATTHGMVRQSGGHIRVESEVGKGSTFRIYLPSQPRVQHPVSEAAPQPVKGGSERILLVDDDTGVRKITKRILEKLGYRVTEAGDGEEALAAFERQPEQFNMVLTDIIMPRMGGSALADKVRVLQPDIPILFMSGYTQDQDAPEGACSKSRLLVDKPFTESNLARQVREILDGAGGSRYTWRQES